MEYIEREESDGEYDEVSPTFICNIGSVKCLCVCSLLSLLMVLSSMS